MITEDGRIKVYILEGNEYDEGLVFERYYSSVGLAEKALNELDTEDQDDRYYITYKIRAVLLDGSLNESQYRD